MVVLPKEAIGWKYTDLDRAFRTETRLLVARAPALGWEP